MFKTVEYFSDDGAHLILDKYETDCQVVRKKTTKRNVKIHTSKKGYQFVPLYANKESKKSRNFLLHRLFASTFYGKPEHPSFTPNHKNRIKGDNRVDNLEWASKKEQVEDRNEYEQPNMRIPIVRVDSRGNETYFDGSYDAAKRTSHTRSSIREWCYKHRKCMAKDVYGGRYTWKFADTPEDLPGENWKFVEGEKKAVSQFGRVLVHMNEFYTSKRYAKEYTSEGGYPAISVNGKMKFIHVLVAEQFIDNPENKPIVNHIDRMDTENASVANLEWATASENTLHAYDNGAFDGTTSARMAIRAVKLDTGEEFKFSSQHEAAKVLDIQQGGISASFRKEHYTYGGFAFFKI